LIALDNAQRTLVSDPFDPPEPCGTPAAYARRGR
jgi:hypothetical protein